MKAIDQDLLLYFRSSLLNWHDKCGRQLPWRKDRTPFQVLVAEILLQQTDARRVWPVYEALVKCFPDPKSLARAPTEEIIRLIEPLGLHYRAARLKEIAVCLTEKYNGIVPYSQQALLEMPGIGPYVAAATLCFAFGEPVPLIDVNFARVYRRFFGLGGNGLRPQRDSRLLSLSQYLVPTEASRAFNYSVLDFAGTICTDRAPKCRCCVLSDACALPQRSAGCKMMALDLFAGAGGLSLGAVSAGVSLAYAIESDSRVATTYEFNFPHTAVVKERLRQGCTEPLCRALGLSQGSIDVLIAGPPCQGFSIANLRTRNNANPKNHVWRVVLDFINYLRPKGVIIENVGGMETYRTGEVISELKQTLRDYGYRLRIYRLNAADFGVPQHRRRLFIAAVENGALPEEVPSNNAPVVTVGMAIGDLPLVPNDNKTDQQPYRLYGSAPNQFQRRMRKKGCREVRNCLTSRNSELIVRRFATVQQGGNWEDIPKDLFTTYSKPENCHRWLYRRLAEDCPSVTISNFRKNMLIHPWLNRTLSVREAARLQGFHDSFVFLGKLRSQQQQVANAVPPQMADAVVKVVLKALRSGN